MENTLLNNLVCFTPACAGIVTDIERFVRRFLSSWQPNYKVFKELFKEMQMSTIFMGRRNIHSLRGYNPFGGYRSLDSLLMNEQKETLADNNSALALLDNILSSDVLQTVILIQQKLVDLLSRPEAESFRSLLPSVIYEDIGKEIETIIANAKKKVNNSSECENQKSADPSSQGDVQVVGDHEDVPSTSTGYKSILERREALKRFAYSYIPSRPRSRWGIEEENKRSSNKETPKTASPTSSLEQTKEISAEENTCAPLNKPFDRSSRGIRRSSRIRNRRAVLTSRRPSSGTVGEPATTMSGDVNLPTSNDLEMDAPITEEAEEAASCTRSKRGRPKRAKH
ncbi:SNAPc SNAP43 domain containing protein [Trichuris trichiura]|uniref:SNAPc SNAP43 domain containing protein n=1 Tax=Trichuris trichiura TaxID=36087 RepID=A0A077Z6G6_TRITR|nr:SNAPc SNAP43 domain containing protein [Trichuris trichiura]